MATGNQEAATDTPRQHEFDHMQYRQMFDPAMKNEWDDEDGISPETEKKDKLIKHCLLLPPTNDQKEYAKKKKLENRKK